MRTIAIPSLFLTTAFWVARSMLCDTKFSSYVVPLISVMESISQELWLPENVKPVSVSQLEADVVSSDIVNPTIKQGNFYNGM